MFALGLLSWMYGRPIEGTIDYARDEVRQEARRSATPTSPPSRPATTSARPPRRSPSRYEVKPAERRAGRYRNITGNLALSYGLVAAGRLSGPAGVPRRLPDHPGLRHPARAEQAQGFGVTTFQAEDEIAGDRRGDRRLVRRRTSGVTSTSGPGRRAEVRGDGPGGDARAAAGGRRRPARRPVDRPADQDRAGRPAAGDVRPQRRGAAAGDRGPVARATASTPRSRRAGSRSPTAPR